MGNRFIYHLLVCNGQINEKISFFCLDLLIIWPSFWSYIPQLSILLNRAFPRWLTLCVNISGYSFLLLRSACWRVPCGMPITPSTWQNMHLAEHWERVSLELELHSSFSRASYRSFTMLATPGPMMVSLHIVAGILVLGWGIYNWSKLGAMTYSGILCIKHGSVGQYD